MCKILWVNFLDWSDDIKTTFCIPEVGIVSQASNWISKVKKTTIKFETTVDNVK
jgi:hypothetical protein